MGNERAHAMKRTLAIFAVFGLLLALTLSSGVEPVFATDTDGDGLSDAMEAVFGTNENLADSDGDNLNDFDEIYQYGTDPNLQDTDGDATNDDTDPDPLDDGTSQGGVSTPDRSYTSNLTKPAPAGTSPSAGFRVNAISGEMIVPVATIDFGAGYRGRNVLSLVYYSGIDHNGRWGRNILSNWDWWASKNGSKIDFVTTFGHFEANEIGGVWIVGEGMPFTVAYDSGTSEITLTAIRGGTAWTFDETTMLLEEIQDRFGNTTTIAHDVNGAIGYVDFPEGNRVTLDTYATGRYSEIEDWGTTSRTWNLTYNCKDDLAKFEDALGNITQFSYIHGSATPDLNHNMMDILLPGGEHLVKVEYDGSDRVSKQTLEGAETCTFTYTSTSTTVNDFAGNQVAWAFTAGACVPNSKTISSNRDVRAGDPATWVTTYSHSADFLREKVVLPEGNCIDYDWDANFCLTEIRMKTSDTDTDNNTNDLVWTNTYGSTYYQLEDSTDPRGNTIERTLNADELVSRIDYPDITHPTPDIEIYETFTWNAYGQLVNHTDGEGVVTKHEYYTSGEETGLLETVTVDYGVGKLNLETDYGWTEYRHPASVTDPDGNSRVLLTDVMGHITKVTIDPNGLDYETTFTFDVNGYLSAKAIENVDEAGTRDTGHPWWDTSYSRDAFGRPTSITEDVTTSTNRITSMEYDGNGNMVGLTLPTADEVVQVFDERGLLASRTRGYDTLFASTEYWDYDLNGNPDEYTNGRSKTWTKSYDDFGRLNGTETPVGHYTTLVLDKNGNVTEIKGYDSTDTLLAHTKRYYDEISRCYKQEEWLDHPAPTADEWLATTFDHDNRGLLELVTDPLDHETAITWDNARRKTGFEDHLGNETTFAFTNDSFVPTTISEIENVPGGGTQTFVTTQTTDAMHRVTQRDIVDRLDGNNKHTFKWKYTSLSVAAEAEDAEGNKTYRTANGLGWVTKEWRDMGGGDQIDAWYGYDLNGNLISLKDDDLNETVYRFNPRGVLYETEYDDGEKRTLTILDDDLVGGWTDENGTIVTNTYNDDGLLTARSINRANGVLGPTSESYSWDGLGRLTEAKNTDTTVQRTYNTLSQMLTETQGPNPIGLNGKTFTYTFEDCGGRESIEYPSGFTIDYTSDALGRWTLLEDSNGNDLVTNTFYGGGFRYATIDYLNGTDVAMGYDGFKFLTDIDHTDSGSTTFAGFDYAYDQMGNPLWVEHVHDSGAGNIYAYDAAYRLESALMGSADPSGESADDDWADYAHVEQIDYNMDDVSNRTSKVDTPYQGSASTVSYTADELNQYTLIGANSQTHDDNGNLTDDGVYDMAYDYRNNLVKVTYGAVVLSECEFDALGRRKEQITADGNFTTVYFYDGEHTVEEYDGSDDILRKFVYGQRIDEIRVMISPDYADVDADQNTTEVMNFYYHMSLLGTVTHITDEGENVVESYEYTPYGETTIKDINGSTISTSAIENPYRYTARRQDDSTGLYHYRRRAYDPERGRFLQRDPLGYVDSECLSSYVRSNPIRASDPYGLEELTPEEKFRRDMEWRRLLKEDSPAGEAARETQRARSRVNSRDRNENPGDSHERMTHDTEGDEAAGKEVIDETGGKKSEQRDKNHWKDQEGDRVPEEEDEDDMDPDSPPEWPPVLSDGQRWNGPRLGHFDGFFNDMPLHWLLLNQTIPSIPPPAPAPVPNNRLAGAARDIGVGLGVGAALKKLFDFLGRRGGSSGRALAPTGFRLSLPLIFIKPLYDDSPGLDRNPGRII